MAEFPPKSQRDQLLGLVTFLGVAAIVAFYMLVWSEKHAELNTMQERVDKLVATNDSAKREMAGGTLRKLEQQAAQLRGDLDVMRQLVPTGNEVPLLLDQVSNAARRAGLELADVQPEPVIRGQAFDAYRYRMAVIGDYHQIGDFLANVGSLTRIITPMNVTMSPMTQRTSRRRREGEQILETRFQIQTYVAKTATSAVPVAAGGMH